MSENKKTKVGLTFELHKKIDAKDFELATNKKCLENWNCAVCLSYGITKQAEWHSTEQCRECSGTDKLYLRMAFCKEHLSGNVRTWIEI